MKDLTTQILDKEREYLSKIKALEGENRALKAKLNNEPIDPMDLGIPNICFSYAKNWGHENDERMPTWKEQRCARGFDSTETWGLDTVIAKFIVPRLEVFLLNTEGVIRRTKKEQSDLNTFLEAMRLVARDDHSSLTDEELSTVSRGKKLFPAIFHRLWY